LLALGISYLPSAVRLAKLV